MEKKQSLFDINLEQKQLIQVIESMEGEITPEMEEQLMLTEKNLKQKSVAYLEVIRGKDAFNSLISEEIKRLQNMKKRNDNVVDRLKENLLFAVKTFGDYEVGTQKFGTRKSTSTDVDIEVSELPERYTTKKLTITANKSAITTALKLGEKIKGCKLVEHQNLKIN